MNDAHKECIEILRIIHQLSKSENIKYTIAGPTVIEYDKTMCFDDCTPIIYIAVVYPDYLRLCSLLKKYVVENPEYSFHDYYNTNQWNSYEAWFVKEPVFQLPEKRKEESFYYGTRLIITPLFFAGNTDKEWREAYNLFKDTIYAMNVRSVLKGQPLKFYIKTTRKRRMTNYYIRNREKYTFELCVNKYGGKTKSKYLIYPFMIRANKNDSNSMPRIADGSTENMIYEKWIDVEEIKLWGGQCYIVKDFSILMKCFPEYYVKAVTNKTKSQLELNGNAYLWRVQQIQLELLIEFDRICRKHNVKYNISFGTLLGAVRHGGFIPWDDDIDVTMHYSDYNKLDEIMQEELDNKKYFFRSPQNEKNNHLIFKHLERKGTTYTKPGREKLEQQIGVFIDIFPMYPSAHFKLSDWIHAKVCRYWRTALWATVGADSEKNEKKRKKYKKMARPGSRICYDKFVRAATFFKNDKYLKFWIPVTRNPYKVPLVKASNYTDTIDMEFEGYKFMVPKNYEEILKYSFGSDWRKYPSVRGRIPSHNAIMQIGNLYLKESLGEKK